MAQWFENWFDSSFYHKLYFDRDENEATVFMANLISYLQPTTPSFMLDVACGKGRHSKTLANYGHFVTGIDISPASIAYAKQFETETLEFFQHDMRLTFRINYYNYVFNLFTSFGYFNTQRENEDALRTITHSLKPGGIFVFDYLNTPYVSTHLIAEETKTIDDTTFTVKRYKTPFHFIKQIQIEDASLPIPLLHQEQVATYTLHDFQRMFAKQGLTIINVFGSYQLDTYNANNSKRLIIVAIK